ncbi:hypothetical protein JCM11491_005710 [Sporobolomyces phaffii]
MAHLHASRTRPEPLSLDHSNGSSHHAHRTSTDRARLLSSLRSAPIPQAYTHSPQQYQPHQQPHDREQQQFATMPRSHGAEGAQFDPRSAAYLQFQQAQTAYLAELQRQILVKQNEIWINQQQIEAEAALRQMNLEAEREREREREWHADMEHERQRTEIEHASRSNPLVASALARRKRQSLTVEARARLTTPPASSSTVSHSPPSTAGSSVRSTPPPPAVILSAPGEPYPDTSSASGSESGDIATRPSTPSSVTESPLSRLELTKESEEAELLQRHQEQRAHEQALLLDQELKASRRRTSHLDALSDALGARQKRRPASLGGGSPLLLSASSPSPSSSPRFSPRSPDLTTPRPHQVSFGYPHSPNSPRSSPRMPGGVSSGYTPRSVSDSYAYHHLLRSPVAASSSSPSLSSNAPSSPGQQFEPTQAYISAKPAVLPGHAFAVRQPRGPPTNLSLTSSAADGNGGGGDETNFGARIRHKAIENLKGLRNGRNRMSGGLLTSDDLSYFGHAKPFKNPHYDRKSTGQISSKRNKSLKQILVLERERIDHVLERTKLGILGPDCEQPMDTTDAETKTQAERDAADRARERREEQLMQAFSRVVSYSSVEAPPSLLPPKKYCDVTGLEAKYVDPKSTLRYHNPEMYELVKTFQPAVIQAYLGVRGQGVVLR